LKALIGLKTLFSNQSRLSKGKSHKIRFFLGNHLFLFKEKKEEKRMYL
jgi:hypothetical protein